MEGIEYHVRAILEASRAPSMDRVGGWASNLASHSATIEGMGRRIMGTAARTAASYGTIAAGAALAAGQYGMMRLIQGSIDFNRRMEDANFSLASTLQLMNRNADAGPGQFAANIADADAAMEDLMRRAAASPASFEQAQQLFRGMLPGAAQVTDSMEEILDLSEAALSLGVQLGGDYQQAGADLRRIITGQAGADVRAWVEGLQTPIHEAGIELKYFNKNTQIGQDLTQKFNRLSPEKRWELVNKAVMKLGPATEYAGGMWAGLSSTLLTDLELLKRSFGRAGFDSMKRAFARIAGPGGVLDPTGDTFKKLEQAASFLGNKIGKGIEWATQWLITGIDYVANNWADIYEKLKNVFQLALRAARMYVRFAAMRTVVGAGVAAGGRAGQFAAGMGKRLAPAMKHVSGAAYKAYRAFGILGGGMKGLKGSAAMFGKSIMSVGSAFLYAIPIVMLLGAALLGVFGFVGAGIAYFLSQWDQILLGFNNGTLTLGPLMDALEIAWDGFRRVGEALWGGATAGNMFERVIYMMTDGVYFLIAAFAVGMKVMGAFQFVFNIIQIGFRTIYLVITGMIRGIVGALSWMVQKVGEALAGFAPDAVAMPIVNAGAKLAAATASIDKHMTNTANNMRQDAVEATRMWDAADKMIEGVSSGQWAKDADAWVRKQTGPGAAGTGASGGSDKLKKPAGNVTHIHKMEVHQDLRNMDPDRVIGAFYDAVDKAVTRRTQAYGVTEQGV